MKILYLYLLLSFFNIGYTQTIGCTHPEVCNLANQMLLKERAILLKKIGGDPHNDKLTSSEIKKIIKADLLIISPLFLQPWGLKIQQMRKKRSINLTLNPALFLDYPKTSKQVLAHFWLLPQQLEFIAKSLATSFSKLAITYRPLDAKSILQLTTKRKELMSCLKDKTIILSHNALRPFLQFPTQKIIALKSSKHHGHLSARNIKRLQQQISKSKRDGTKLVWIIEKNIHLPQTITKWISSQDITINFDALGTLGDPVELPLTNLIFKLKQATCPPQS